MPSVTQENTSAGHAIANALNLASHLGQFQGVGYRADFFWMT